MLDLHLAADATLIDDIYAAALGDVEWSSPLLRLQAATGMRFAALMALESGSQLPAVDAIVSDDIPNLQSLVQNYTAEYHLHDPTPGFVAKWPAGRWFMDHQAISPKARARDIYYQEFLRPHGGGNWAGLFLNRGQERSAFLSFVGAPGNPMGAAQQRRIDAVADHFARAVQIRHRLGDLHQRCALATSVLDMVEAPLFLLDDTGRLLLDNAAARALAAAHPHALHFAQGRFVPPLPGWQAEHWHAACARGTLVLQQVDGLALPLFLTPVPPQVALARHWQRPLVLMSAAASASPAVRAQRLRALYGLSVAEAELAVALACEGLSPQDCADARRVAVSTVRSQIKSIQAKLGVARLPLVIRMVLAL